MVPALTLLRRNTSPMETSMHPQDIRKVKALVWFWLNRHPAEIAFVSPTELGSTEFGELGEEMAKDMLIQASNNWNIGEGASARIMCFQDPDRWHDINKVVFEWVAGLGKGKVFPVISYLRAVKGEPIDRWKGKNFGLPAPDWSDLVERFRGKGYF